jgi:DNA-binding IclR family transcriptional regulator
MGKVLLAFGDDAAFGAALRAPMAGHEVEPPNASKLQRSLRAVRNEGVAEDKGEYLPDVRCVAAPVRAANGRVIAAIDIAAPRSRFERSREMLRVEVQHCAERISEQLRQLGANDLSS